MLQMKFPYNVAEFTPEEIDKKREVMKHINAEFRVGTKKQFEKALKTWKGVK